VECYNSNILKIGADSEKIKSVIFLFGGEFLKNLQIIPIISYGKYSKLSGSSTSEMDYKE
jgi:hypothetical protein